MILAILSAADMSCIQGLGPGLGVLIAQNTCKVRQHCNKKHTDRVMYLEPIPSWMMTSATAMLILNQTSAMAANRTCADDGMTWLAQADTRSLSGPGLLNTEGGCHCVPVCPALIVSILQTTETEKNRTHAISKARDRDTRCNDVMPHLVQMHACSFQASQGQS